jgi:hypothetical protein
MLLFEASGWVFDVSLLHLRVSSLQVNPMSLCWLPVASFVWGISVNCNTVVLAAVCPCLCIDLAAVGLLTLCMINAASLAVTQHVCDTVCVCLFAAVLAGLS